MEYNLDYNAGSKDITTSVSIVKSYWIYYMLFFSYAFMNLNEMFTLAMVTLYTVHLHMIFKAILLCGIKVAILT
jgi:hypothetical protein